MFQAIVRLSQQERPESNNTNKTDIDRAFAKKKKAKATNSLAELINEVSIFHAGTRTFLSKPDILKQLSSLMNSDDDDDDDGEFSRAEFSHQSVGPCGVLNVLSSRTTGVYFGLVLLAKNRYQRRKITCWKRFYWGPILSVRQTKSSLSSIVCQAQIVPVNIIILVYCSTF